MRAQSQRKIDGLAFTRAKVNALQCLQIKTDELDYNAIQAISKQNCNIIFHPGLVIYLRCIFKI